MGDHQTASGASMLNFINTIIFFFKRVTLSQTKFFFKRVTLSQTNSMTKIKVLK